MKNTAIHSLAADDFRFVDGELEPAVVTETASKKNVGLEGDRSSATMTLHRYGRLFPRVDDPAEMAAAEAALLGRMVARC